MPLPFDVNNTVRNQRKQNRRQSQQDNTEISAVLGNESNVLFVPGRNGNEVYVRLLGDAENGNATYQPSVTAFARGSFFEYSGSPIVLKYNRAGNLVVIGADEIQVAQAGRELSLASLNSGSKQNNFLSLDNVTRLMSRPVSRGYADSTLVSVAQFLYDHYGNYVAFNGTELKADKIDLAAYVPAGGNDQRLVQLWLDTYNNTIQVTANTEQSLFVDLDQTDYDEIWDGMVRFQDWIPLQSYVLTGAKQNTITQQELSRDHRKFVNMPDELGNETTLTINTRIRENRQWVIHDSLTIPAGYTLSIEAGGTVLITSSVADNVSNVTIKATDYTLLSTDSVIVFTATATATLPPATGTGITYRIACRSGALTIDGNGTDTIKGALTQTLSTGEDLIITDTITGIWE